MTYNGKRGPGKRRKTTFQPHRKGITFAPAPDPESPIGRAMAEDGTRFRVYPYLQEFVRPLVSDEFEGRQVVSPERMQECTSVFVTRLEPTSVAMTRIPITTYDRASGPVSSISRPGERGVTDRLPDREK